MRNHLIVASVYATAYKARTKKAVITAKNKVVENKSELTRLAATSVIVGVTAHTVGFRAGYAYANAEQS